MPFRQVFTSLVLLLVISINLQSQHLGAYVDYMGRFYIFDKGKSIKIEDHKPQSFKIGGECVLYLNTSGFLKMYAKEKVTQLERGGVGAIKYFAADNLAGYSIFGKLKVIYKDSIYSLSRHCPIYRVEENIIVFYDRNLESLRIFYHGDIQDVETGMLGPPTQYGASRNNIVAYISSRTKDFKIWYQGQAYTIIRNVGWMHFKVGQDIVAYIDPTDMMFKAFYKGEIYELSDFAPQSYITGNQFVAYADEMGEFKVFSNREVRTISNFAPEAYLAVDNNLVYVENGRFMAWYDNEVIEIEAWVPSVFKANWNTIAYLDHTHRIWIFQKGERKYLSNEMVKSFDIYRDLIMMNVRIDRNMIYYQDQFFEGESTFK